MNRTHRLYEGCVAAFLMMAATGCATVDGKDSSSAGDLGDGAAEATASADASADIEVEFASDLGMGSGVGGNNEIPDEDRADPQELRQKSRDPNAGSSAGSRAEDPVIEDPTLEEVPVEESTIEDPLESAMISKERQEMVEEAPPPLPADEEAALGRLEADVEAPQGEEDADWYEVEPEGLVNGDNEAAPVASDAVNVEEEDTSASLRARKTKIDAQDEQLLVLDDMIRHPTGGLADELGAHTALAYEDDEPDTEYTFVDDFFSEREPVEVTIAAVVNDVGIQSSFGAPDSVMRKSIAPVGFGGTEQSVASASKSEPVRPRGPAPKVVTSPGAVGRPDMKTAKAVGKTPVTIGAVSPAKGTSTALAQVSVQKVPTKDSPNASAASTSIKSLKANNSRTMAANGPAPKNKDSHSGDPTSGVDLTIAFSAVVPKRTALATVKA